MRIGHYCLCPKYGALVPECRDACEIAVAADAAVRDPVFESWLADALLAQRLGWSHAVPPLGTNAAFGISPGRSRRTASRGAGRALDDENTQRSPFVLPKSHCGTTAVMSGIIWHLMGFTCPELWAAGVQPIRLKTRGFSGRGQGLPIQRPGLPMATITANSGLALSGCGHW